MPGLKASHILVPTAAALLLLTITQRERIRKYLRKKVTALEPETDPHLSSDVEDLLLPPPPREHRLNSKPLSHPTDPSLPPIYVKTFGCSHNTSDSEYMMGILASHGYPLVHTLEECTLIVINSCTVKNPSQQALLSLITLAEKNQKKIIITGCVPQGDNPNAPNSSLSHISHLSLLGVSQIDNILLAVEETLQGNAFHLLKKKALPSLNLPKVRKNPLVEIIPLSTGCLGNCSYCKTKHARGVLGSYHPSEILQRVRQAALDGVQQIWLTSEDTGAYGIDLNTSIVALLESISLLLSSPDFPKVMVRLGMTNPPYMLEHREKLGEILSREGFFEFLHIPVQSGSNDVLKRMVREYTKEDFSLLVDYLRGRLPWMVVATDIICGFPGEEERDHEETKKMLRDYEFPVVNISQFYARPNTAAARMEKVDSKIVKRRSTEVTGLFESYNWNERYLAGVDGEGEKEGEKEGKEKIMRVWFSDKSAQGQWVGHTKQHVKVVVDCQENLLGKCALIKCHSPHKWHLRGDLVEILY